MESEPRAASQNVSREASEWFVFLQDDPEDLSLRHRFERWLSASPAHAAAWAETLRAASLSESLLPFDARQWRTADPGRPGRSAPPGRARRKWMASLGALAVAAALAFWVGPAVLLHLQADFRTGVAQVRQIDLQDGSIVTMAPGSAIAVGFGPIEREVRLLSGEAFFAVKPDAKRPFTVKAQSLTASVLGTSFDVDLQKNAVSVAVSEGHVRVSAAGVDEIVQGGQAIRVVSGTPRADRSALSTVAAAAWRHGQLVMEDRPFSDAVDYLERYYSGSIVIVGGLLRERPVTGIFDLNDPEAALRTMAKALGVEVRRVSPWLLLVYGS
jgi:transmembrane sensor